MFLLLRILHLFCAHVCLRIISTLLGVFQFYRVVLGVILFYPSGYFAEIPAGSCPAVHDSWLVGSQQIMHETSIWPFAHCSFLKKKVWACGHQFKICNFVMFVWWFIFFYISLFRPFRKGYVWRSFLPILSSASPDPGRNNTVSSGRWQWCMRLTGETLFRCCH